MRTPRGGGVARSLLVAATLSTLAGTALNPPTVASAAGQFVTAAGTQLEIAGQPWRFVGYDAYQLPSLSVGSQFQCGGLYSTAWLGQMLDSIRARSGGTVVRTWFFQSYDTAQLDAVLAAAAQRNMRVIPVLVNQWGDCEPGWGPQGQRPYRTRAWYLGGYRQTGDGYPRSFHDYAVSLATRYAGNPTIAFWQLVNEAEAKDGANGACDNSAAGSALRSFADDMTAAIKAVDHNHLVSLGTMGGGQCGLQGSEYGHVHAGAVDLCEYHDYGAPAVPVPGDQWNGIGPDLQQCAALGKPIFAGEVGIDASIQPGGGNSGTVTAASLQLRATYFAQKLQAQLARGASGFLIWSRSLSPSNGYDVGPGDPTEAVLAAAQLQPAPSPQPQPKTGGAGPPSTGGAEGALAAPVAPAAAASANGAPGAAAPSAAAAAPTDTVTAPRDRQGRSPAIAAGAAAAVPALGTAAAPLISRQGLAAGAATLLAMLLLTGVAANRKFRWYRRV